MQTVAGYEIGLATESDLDGILDLQEANLPHRGGTLSARRSREWLETALETMPVVVARRNGRLVGYLISSPLAAYAGVAVVEAMLRAYRGTSDAYVYGPICVADREQGRGLGGAMFEALRARLRRAKAFCSSAATTRPLSGPMPVWGCRRSQSSPMAPPPSPSCLMSDDRRRPGRSAACARAARARLLHPSTTWPTSTMGEAIVRELDKAAV